jgi:hypothetical protein
VTSPGNKEAIFSAQPPAAFRERMQRNKRAGLVEKAWMSCSKRRGAQRYACARRLLEAVCTNIHHRKGLSSAQPSESRRCKCLCLAQTCHWGRTQHVHIT